MSTLITSSQAGKWTVDTLNLNAQGVYISDSNALDCSNAAKVSGFNLNYTQPGNSKIFIMFQINNKWGYLNTSGAFVEVSSSAPTFETLKISGNTPANLQALSSVPALQNNYAGVAVGLSSDDTANSVPQITIAAKCETSSQTLRIEKLSPVFEFENGAQIISITPHYTISGNGNFTLIGRFAGEDGKFSGWYTAAELVGTFAHSLQFNAVFTVEALNSSDAAALDYVAIVTAENNSHTQGTPSVEGAGKIITNTLNWYVPINECRLTVKHEPLEYSEIRAFVSLRKAPKQITGENLGVGTGGRKTFQIANTDGIKYDAFKLYYDGARVFSDFELNTQAGRVSCTAPEGVIISCDYEYGYDSETWLEMKSSSRVSYETYDATEFKLLMPDNNLTVAAVKLEMIINKGTITREYIGLGTGRTKSYKLSHAVDAGNITVYNNTAKLDSKFYTVHEEDTKYISVAAPSGASLYAAYNWAGASPVIYELAAVFS